MTFKTATKNIFQSKLLILSIMFFVATCFLVKGEKVFAATIYSQLDASSDTVSTADSSSVQFLGNALSGSLGGWDLKFNAIPSDPGHPYDVYAAIYVYSNSVNDLSSATPHLLWGWTTDSFGPHVGDTEWVYTAMTQSFSFSPGTYYWFGGAITTFNYSVYFKGGGSGTQNCFSADPPYSACDTKNLYLQLAGSGGFAPGYSDTHIINLIPNGFTSTTSPFNFSFEFYNGTTTPEGDLDFQLRDQNINQFDPLGQLIREDHAPLTYTEGTHTYSASFTAYSSNYSLTATIFDRLGNVVEATTTYFSITSDSSGLGGQPFYGSYSTTTGFFYGGYSEASSTNIVIAALSNVVTGMKYKIPWGYAFLIYDRISMDLASTSQSVPAFTMTIPGTNVITTSHSDQDLTFNLNHVGDIYATTTIMANGSTFKSQFDGIVRGILWAMFAWSVWVYFVHRRNQEIV